MDCPSRNRPLHPLRPHTCLRLLALLWTLAGVPVAAQIVTLPPPTGLSGETIVAAPPGADVVIYHVGLLGLLQKARLQQIELRLTPLAAPLTAGLDDEDIERLRLVESANHVFGDGDDIDLNTVEHEEIVLDGGTTAITDDGHATPVGLFPLPVGVLLRHYFIVAEIAADARSGHAFRVGADLHHITLSTPAPIGLPVWPSNADRVVIGGLRPDLDIDDDPLDFGVLAAGEDRSITVQVGNTGAADLAIDSITTDDARFRVQPASVTLAPGAADSITVTYAPDAGGTHTGELRLRHNGPDSPVEIDLRGTATAPLIAVAPESLDFDTVPVDSTATLTVDVDNPGNAPLSVAVTPSDPHFATVPASFVLAAGTRQSVQVAFTPNGAASFAGHLVLTHNAAGSPDSVAVRGVGAVAAPRVVVTPGALDFGAVEIGASDTLRVRIGNHGDLPAQISGSTIDDGQFLAAPAAFTLPRGGEQEVQVVYTPTVGGPVTATLAFTVTGLPEPARLSLAGFGLHPGLVPSVGSVAFGNITFGNVGVAEIELTNTSDAPIDITEIATGDAQFSVSTGSLSLAPGQTRPVTLYFAAASLGTQRTILSIRQDGAVEALQLPLRADATVALDDERLDFGAIEPGETAWLPVRIDNPSGADVTITSIVSDNPLFVPDLTTCDIPAGGSHEILVAFRPLDRTRQVARLAITHNPTLIVTLVGNDTGRATAQALDASGQGLQTLQVPFGGEVLGALLICLYALVRRWSV